MEVTQAASIVRDFGIPGLFFIIMLLGMFKWYPDWQKERIAVRAEQAQERETLQKSYDERNKVFADQFSIVVKVAEQGNQVIARSNEVINMATRAIEQNTTIHDKVSAALSRDLAALQELASDLKAHDVRAERINDSVIKLLERIGK